MSKLLGNTQSQEASENSIAIQAGRDLHISTSGLSYRDVREICMDLLEANFPKIRDESLAISMQYVEEFGTKFFERLIKEDPVSTQEKLKDPDVQAAINTSITHVARMTKKSHQDILCELIAEKINSPEEEKNLILNDAIEVMTKITKNQILFLVLVFSLRNLDIYDPASKIVSIHPDKMVHYNFYEKKLPELIGNDIYKIDTSLLIPKGLVNSNSLLGYKLSLPDHLMTKTQIKLTYVDNKNLHEENAFTNHYPNISSLIQKFGFKTIKEFDRVPITPIAKEIASAYLKKRLTEINFNIDSLK